MIFPAGILKDEYPSNASSALGHILPSTSYFISNYLRGMITSSPTLYRQEKEIHSMPLVKLVKGEHFDALMYDISIVHKICNGIFKTIRTH